MSVDYYSCECCGDARYEEFVHKCPNCGRNICEDCFNENIKTPQRIESKDDITEEEYKYLCNKYDKELVDVYLINYGELNPEYCPFCNGNLVHDDDLLKFALQKLQLTREQLKQEYLDKQ